MPKASALSFFLTPFFGIALAPPSSEVSGKKGKTKVRNQLLALLVCLGLSSMGWARGAHGNGSEGVELIGGTAHGPLQPSLYPSVINLNGFCTATKVGARTFITAAHCLMAASGDYKEIFKRGQSFSITNLPNPYDGIPWLPVHTELAKADPGYAAACAAGACDASTAQNHTDIGIFQIQEDTPLIPVAAMDYRYILPNDVIDIVGYGCEALGGGPRTPEPNLSFGRMKYVTTRVGGTALTDSVHLPADALVQTLAFFTFGHAADPASGGLCEGDSGGPAFLRAPGVFAVVGVNGSRWSNDAGTDTQANQHSRLSNAVPWMPAYIR